MTIGTGRRLGPAGRSFARPTGAAGANGGSQCRDFAAGLGKEPNPKVALAAAVLEGVKAGRVRSRADVLEVLREFGEINRDGDDYVSVRLAGRAKPVRLKGLLFVRDLDVGAVLRSVANPGNRRSGREPPDLRAPRKRGRRWSGVRQAEPGITAGDILRRHPHRGREGANPSRQPISTMSSRSTSGPSRFGLSRFSNWIPNQ